MNCLRGVGCNGWFESFFGNDGLVWKSCRVARDMWFYRGPNLFGAVAPMAINRLIMPMGLFWAISLENDIIGFFVIAGRFSGSTNLSRDACC